MKVTNSRAIGNWLSDIEEGSLCLPRFQREVVWSRKKICQFLTTLITDTDSPVGIFLVLSTDPTDPAFPPRNIDGAPSPEAYDKLLLDGQQRLTALWKALVDTDGTDGDRFYVVFDTNYEITGVVGVNKRTPTNQRLAESPTRECKKKWLPARLLNPLVDNRVVDKWIREVDATKLPDGFDLARIKKLIMTIREIFLRKGRKGKIIPHFLLGQNTDSKKAIEIYRLINTNLVKLSDHYLAVAQMEAETSKSLYDMAGRLIDKVPSLKGLETDEIGELILKISCLLQNKPVSGGSFRNLSYSQILSDEDIIFDGVKWAVECLSQLNIWYERQLPSVVPLRVLPALHRFMPKSGVKLAKANALIKRYLWHCFLTNRYDRQANDRLRTDYKELAACLKSPKIDSKNIQIFKKRDHPIPNIDTIKEATWPSSRSVLARGILLACCQTGAKSLQSEEELTHANFLERQKHHIFPRSILSKKLGHPGLVALNCMLIPKTDNDAYENFYPGDYMEQAMIEGDPSYADDDSEWKKKAEKLLETHMIPKKCAQILFGANAESCKTKRALKLAYTEFINERAKTVRNKIRNLLK